MVTVALVHYGWKKRYLVSIDKVQYVNEITKWFFQEKKKYTSNMNYETFVDCLVYVIYSL